MKRSPGYSKAIAPLSSAGISPIRPILILVLAALIPYLNSFRTPFVFDDLPRIVENPDIRGLQNLPTTLIYGHGANETNFYYRNDPSRPVVYLSYAINYAMGKLNPFLYHCLNWLLHTANCLLVFFLFRRLLSLKGDGNSITVPLLTAVLVAVHPVNVDAVTYIYGRSNLLEALFFLSAIFLFTLQKTKWLPASITCFVLALFSKQSAATLPAVLLVIDFVFISNLNYKEVLGRKHVHFLFWATLVCYLAYRWFYFGGLGDIEAGGEILNQWQYVLSQPGVLLRYLGLLVFPCGLNIYHSVPEPTGLLTAPILGSIVAFVLLMPGIFLLSKRITKSYGLALFGLGWFFIVVSPTSSVFATTQPMVERRLYLAEIGIFFLGLFLVRGTLEAALRKPLRFKFAALVLMVLGLTAATWHRNYVFSDPVRLWQDSISKTRGFHLPATKHLGYALLSAGRVEEAAEKFRQIQEYQPRNFDALNVLGRIYKATGKYDLALTTLRQASRLRPARGDLPAEIGLVYLMKKEPDSALAHLRAALQQHPKSTDVLTCMAFAYGQKAEYDSAVLVMKRVIDLKPGDPRTYFELARLFLKKGDRDSAIVHLRKGQALAPNNRAFTNALARLLRNQ